MKDWRFWIFGLCVAALLAGSLYWAVAEDPTYEMQSTLAFGSFRKYDPLITQTATSYGVPPELIKAVIWKESRFQPDKVGTQGERGLMQVTEIAAKDWAKAEKVTTFAPNDLFDPKVNIQVGTWYLKRALGHWSSKDNPIPFALAEYNAGRTRVKRWVKDSGQGESAGAGDLQTAMDFPSTRAYVAAIMARYDYYKRHKEPAP